MGRLSKKSQKGILKIEKAKVVVEEKSVYNCLDCKGLGLKNESERCPKCLGTGKV